MHEVWAVRIQGKGYRNETGIGAALLLGMYAVLISILGLAAYTALMVHLWRQVDKPKAKAKSWAGAPLMPSAKPNR